MPLVQGDLPDIRLGCSVPRMPEQGVGNSYSVIAVSKGFGGEVVRSRCIPPDRPGYCQNIIL